MNQHVNKKNPKELTLLELTLPGPSLTLNDQLAPTFLVAAFLELTLKEPQTSPKEDP